MAKTAAKPKGERLPGFSTARRFPHSGMKDVILAQPICPNSQIRGRMVDGHYEPPENAATNCQMGGGKWWIACEEKGHDPYWTKRDRLVTRMTFKIDEEGDKIPIEKKVYVEERFLNTTSVSTSVRLGSGQSVRWKKRYFGYRPISDFGYEEVCHLGRCQNPIKLVDKEHGAFCSMEHLQLAAADDNEIILVRTDHEWAIGEEKRIQRLRARQLRNAVDNIEVQGSDEE